LEDGTAVPLYDYKCTSCDHHYETREGFDAPSRQPCPQCGSVAKRILHPPPIVFKGSGFYITDSRKGSQATLADNSFKDGGETKSGASSSSSAPDSKPAAAATSSDD
jgi:putative FmdB family regulatory protein